MTTRETTTDETVECDRCDAVELRADAEWQHWAQYVEREHVYWLCDACDPEFGETNDD